MLTFGTIASISRPRSNVRFWPPRRAATHPFNLCLLFRPQQFVLDAERDTSITANRILTLKLLKISVS
ncbi:hypothetical protein Hypma_013971 [Hypsizygus marmoreus]|uniref:Uncharacterized protein n=1 Tax=Hypsizygus marmoreus TaxID=39966 RepID=A0A369K8S6_HYPMA|nr:hypothetical protein Hypma_013971 [Hypsizygus marmoreus]